MSDNELSFGEAYEQFEAGLIDSTELMWAAKSDAEIVMAATAIANRHSCREGGFPHASNALTGALMRVTDPVQIAKLRIGMAMVYNSEGHQSYARTLVERGIEVLGTLTTEAAASTRTQLKTMHEALAPA